MYERVVGDRRLRAKGHHAITRILTLPFVDGDRPAETLDVLRKLRSASMR